MAVEADAGATVISRLVAEPSLRAGSLKVVPFALPDRAFTALRHRERYFSKAAQALLHEIRGEIRQLRHAHAIDARRQSTARTCRRRHFHRRGNLHQYRGATGASAT